MLEIGQSVEQHDFRAVYTRLDWEALEFFVDSKMVWRIPYPDVSGNEFHLVLTSHKVSSEEFDLSGNFLAVKGAKLAGSLFPLRLCYGVLGFSLDERLDVLYG